METEHFSPIEQPEINTSELRQQLMKPFTDDEIEGVWAEISKWRTSSFPPVKNILHRYDQGFDYAINIVHVDDDVQLEFQLTNPETKKVAHMIFEENSKHHGDWNMMHRLVDTGELGISGSEFLEHSENYLRLLAQRKYISLNKFEAEASQSTVIEWLQKNKYRFSTPEDIATAMDIQTNPDDYDQVYIADDPNKYLSEPFLFKKSLISEDELTLYLDTDQKDNKHFLVPHQNGLKLKGLVRVHLDKELEP